MIEVKIVADSINEKNRLTTFELIYPRYIHAQMLTHRVFTKNTASSRAIPTLKLIEGIEANPVIPKEWGANESGMQSYKVLDLEKSKEADIEWYQALQNAIQSSKKLASLGVHKQFVNRLLEPFAHTQVILSATEFENFFNLRRWKAGKQGAAQHEIAEVAEKMFQSLEISKPIDRYWHIPYYDSIPDIKFSTATYPFDSLSKEETDLVQKVESFGNINFQQDVTNGFMPVVSQDTLKIMSAIAKAARASYTKHNEEKSIVDDIKLDYKLYREFHCSPFEHIACQWEPDVFGFANFKGWMQLRTLLFEN